MKGQNREHRKVEKTMKGQKGESGEIEMWMNVELKKGEWNFKSETEKGGGNVNLTGIVAVAVGDSLKQRLKSTVWSVTTTGANCD